MKRILVTGYTGFVGTNLTDYLIQHDFEVVGVGRNKPAGFHFKQYNYDELAPIKDYDAMIHLAGKAHDMKNTADATAYLEANTQLTKRVFDAFVLSKATDFIYLSSVKAAADTVDGILVETCIPDPATHYGISKLKAETYLLSKELPAGKRLFILRPCLIHGPGNKGNLYLLYRLVKKGIPYPLAAFKNKRSLLSMQNLLFIIQSLLNNGAIKGGVYHIADDEPLVTTQIVDIMAETMQVKLHKWHINQAFVNALAVVGDKLRLPFNTLRLKKLTENYIVSNDKIKKAVGINAMPVAAREGLINTMLNL
ncbi:MAG: NAD-dependent epimerase/dehydratase family protein [Sphingobacteriaceae bacterium]|nr:MAG: NAD-dependent epimerase/dehydratase family protein [Sphingobacteriaceae bacterium]